jgi:hypothetical protein
VNSDLDLGMFEVFQTGLCGIWIDKSANASASQGSIANTDVGVCSDAPTFDLTTLGSVQLTDVAERFQSRTLPVPTFGASPTGL